MKINILIVDDHPYTRAGVRAMLEGNSEISIVGEAVDGLDAISQVIEKEPDMVVMDITMPNLSGIEATKEILDKFPDVKVIALSIHSGDKFVKEMLKAGALAYLLKDEVPEELLAAIAKVAKGEMYLCSGVTRAALSKTETEFTSFNILRTKLLRPPVIGNYIVRENIINELDQNIVKPFTLVSAGAGYGKSITVSQWLEQSNSLYAWISLDEEQNDFRTFLFYLVEGIELVIPGALKKTREVIIGVELPPFDQLVNILFNDLCELDQEIILVLDDYHKINNTKIHDLFNEWLRFPPPNVHLCIITRRDPPLKIKSLKLSGRMTEIRMKQLSFANEEIAILFQKLLNIELSDHNVNMLHDKTEGWIIALKLVSMIIKTPENIDQVLKSFEGGMSTISDYLITEVLPQLPAKIKNQLLSSSILNRFNIDLLNEISNTEHEGVALENEGENFIHWLLNANMFIIELDLEGTWFRYHHMFRQLLNSQLNAQFSKAEIDQLNQRASYWFEQHGHLEEAVHHAVVLKDYNRAAQIIKKHRINLLNNFKWLTLEKLLSNLPESIINESIELLLIKAYMVFNRTDLIGLSEQVTRMEELLENVEKPEKLEYYGEFVFYQAHIYLLFQNDIKKTFERLKLAMKLVPESQSELRGRTELLYSITAHTHGKYEETYKQVQNRDVGEDVDPILRNRRYLALLWLPLMAAKLDVAERYDKPAVETARKNMGKEGLAWSLYLSTILLLKKGEWPGAIIQLEELMNIKYSWYTMTAVDGMSALITVYLLTDQSEKANTVLNNLEEFVNPLPPFYQQFLWAAKARYYTLTGDHKSLKSIIGNQQIISIGNPGIYFEVPAHTECWALIYEGSASNLELAGEKLLELIAVSEGQFNILHLIELLIYQAIMYDKQGRDKESFQSLLKAVSLAEPGKVKSYFVEMGKPIMEILNKMPEEYKENAYLHELINTISSTPLYQTKIIEKKQTKKESLNVFTQRELKVLQYVAEGLRNQEIAAKMFNSEETIKKHIYNMFQKLYVKNRLSLVTKARDEGILK